MNANGNGNGREPANEAGDDAKLRAAMHALREHDATRAPELRAMLDRPAPPVAVAARLGRALPVAASLAVAAAVVGLFLRQEPERALAPSAAAPAVVAPAAAPAAAPADLATASRAPSAPARDDIAPLDFLLDAPLAAQAAPAVLDFLVKDPAR